MKSRKVSEILLFLYALNFLIGVQLIAFIFLEVYRLMSKPIDYSKWNAFNDEDSDVENLAACSEPHFTRLERPSQVVVGPDGLTVGEESACSGAHKLCENISEEIEALGESCLMNDTSVYSKLSTNGAKESDSHWWSQTETTVSVSFSIPSEIKAKDILKFRVQEKESIHNGNSLLRPHLELSYKKRGGEVVEILKEFFYPLNLDSDLLEGCWEIEKIGEQRVITFQFFKKEVAKGVSLWWDRCFSTDVARVDLDSLAERRGNKSTQFKQVWEDAHQLFKQRVAKRKGMSKTL